MADKERDEARKKAGWRTERELLNMEEAWSSISIGDEVHVFGLDMAASGLQQKGRPTASATTRDVEPVRTRTASCSGLSGSVCGMGVCWGSSNTA